MLSLLFREWSDRRIDLKSYSKQAYFTINEQKVYGSQPDEFWNLSDPDLSFLRP